MHARYLVATGLVLGSLAVLASACYGVVEPPDEPGGASATTAEPTAEAAQEFAVCECSVKSDFCSLTVGGKCVVGFNSCTKTPSAGCGFGGFYPCVGWCVRR
jgi:hypothetical protein